MVATANGRQKLAADETQVSNGGAEAIEAGIPYQARVTVVGVASLLFHRWNSESVAEKAKAAKGSTAKKTDNIESYVYRTPEGNLGVAGANFAAAIHLAGKFEQDPRSPRKSMFDLCKAAIVPLDEVAPFEPLTAEWDYEDARRVTVQRAGVTRVRPAMRAGWTITFGLLVNLPEYISPIVLNKLVSNAGRVVGLCDFRPSYGRFAIRQFEVIDADGRPIRFR